MSDVITIAAITTAGTVAVAVINSKIKHLSKQVNGRMDELLETTRKLAKAEQKQEDNKT